MTETISAVWDVFFFISNSQNFFPLLSNLFCLRAVHSLIKGFRTPTSPMFKLTLTFPTYSSLFAIHPGSSPQYSKGTYIPVFPTKERQSSWRGRITDTTGNTVTMGIIPMAECIVGKYQMYIAVMTPFGIRRTRYDNKQNLYILFNPWAAGQFMVLWVFSSH